MLHCSGNFAVERLWGLYMLKIVSKRVRLGLGLALGLGLILCLSPQVAAYSASLSAKHHVEQHPAAVTITAHIDATGQTIVVPVTYNAAYRLKNQHKHYKFDIRAIEVLVNGIPRHVQQLKPSPQGQTTISIPLASIDPHQDGPKPATLTVQAKAYKKLGRKGTPKHLAAISNLATLNVTGQSPVATWNPASLKLAGLAGTAMGATVEVTAKQTINAATISVSSSLQDMLAPSLNGEIKLEPATPYSLPLAVNIPASKQSGTYQGTVELHDASQPGLPLAQLPVTIMVTALSNNTIPQAINTPSADRIVEDQGDLMVEDQIDLGLSHEVTDPDQRIKQIAAETHATIVGSLPGGSFYQLRFDVTGPDQLASIRDQLATTAGVDFASRSFFTNQNLASNTPPDDPLSGAWDEANPAGNNWSLEYIKAPSAWRSTTGDRQTRIGVIDGGFDLRHEDLKAEVVKTYGFEQRTQDDLWHGNFVSGVACATGNNSVGLVGVNWRCGLGMYAVDSFGSRSFRQNTANIVAAMQQAAKDDMRVVNLSLGYAPSGCRKTPQPPECQRRLREASDEFKKGIELAKQSNKDILWVFSAGNDNQDAKNESPALLGETLKDNTLTVAAINPDATLWRTTDLEGSNFGPAVSVAAPGSKISSTYSAIKYPSSACRSKGCNVIYAESNGTSAAAPFVSGLAGLVLSAHGDFSAKQVRQCIIDAASTYGAKVSGHNFSVISAPEAVTCGAQTPDCQFTAPVQYRCESRNPNIALRASTYGNSTACTFSAHIDWGDGAVQDFSLPGTAAGPILDVTHRYAKPGTYYISASIDQASGPGGVACLVLGRYHEFRLLSAS